MSPYVALLVLIDHNIVEAKVSPPIQLTLTISLYYISKVSTRDLCFLFLAPSCLMSAPACPSLPPVLRPRLIRHAD
jgi:hypothetical protein